jgi:putative redox protein
LQRGHFIVSSFDRKTITVADERREGSTMSIVRTAIGVTPYAVTITAGQHKLIADEPVDHGGRDAGPAPYDLVLAGLGACSAITLRMYADRKQLTIRALEINLSFHKEGDRGVIRRIVHLDADLTPEQRARFADIIERTPVTLTLKAGSDIRTEFK